MSSANWRGAAVSVVIPTFNSASVVCDAVESALDQSRAPFEIIVVDDGGADDTADRLAALAARDAPIHYIRQPNAGPSRARNIGAAAARGDWLAFLDADDVWRHDKLAEQLAAAAARDVDAVFCAVLSHETEPPTILDYPGATTRAALLPALLGRNVLAGGCSSLLIRRDAFQALGGFDEDMPVSEDREFFIRLADACRIAYLRRPLVHRRAGPVHQGGDPERLRAGGERIMRRHAHRLAGLRWRRLTLRRARAALHERVGMAYLARGGTREALRDLRRAVRCWPFAENAWKGLMNVWTGRRRVLAT